MNSIPYKDSSLPVEKRVADLLSRMTLEEKAAQMTCIWEQKKNTFIDENGHFDEKKAKESFKHGNGIGQIGRPNDTGGGLKPKEHAEFTNTVQKFFIENSRLGIPVIFHEECLHGLMAVDSTSFSQPIGLGATFNIDLVQKLFEMTAEEARVRGTHQALTPVVDVAREPRWGRVEETYGEDPYLVAQMGIAAVKGFQGDATFKNKKHIIATLKHFAAHGQPESGCNCAPANVSERILREVFLYTFKEVIQKAGAISVMPSYNEIDGIPSHANKWLLRDVLRGEWEFKGFTVSDYYAIRELNERPKFFGNFLAEDGKQAAALAIKAGVNIELPEPDCYKNIVELVKEGTIKESMLDELVAPMLEWKFRLGLFEDPYVDPEIAEKVVSCEKNKKLALQAARETITLLKNDGVAPIKPKKIKTIAVIGPNADRVMIGGYSSVPPYHITVLEGIRQRAGKCINVLYHEGCKITIGGSWFQDEVILADPAENRKSIKQAVKVAKQADVIILAIGGNEQTSREGWMYNHMGDRASLDMVGQQDELVDAMVATGKPVIAVLFNGKPLSIRNLSEKASAIFECWYLGQESGKAIAEAIFGDYNPGGKLPISIPRSVGHVPCYYNYKPAARRGYLFDEVSPLYAFGYGLSYTKFEFAKPKLKCKNIKANESTTVSVKVTNSGKQTGDEVVQMYIRDKISSVTRPVKELKGFKRITLEPGKSKTVNFEITPELLSFYDINMEYTVEPGEFEIMIGNSSRNEDLQKIILTVEK
ncbi:MAG: glycoside hydrolase family 3 C-terminal domain-containing protein [Sedimentisphaerales bacterium]|nr:glycoside hydrolase family 3 C-terminal domain-containing protein [Sedimentisphaerales bacterium]